MREIVAQIGSTHNLPISNEFSILSLLTQCGIRVLTNDQSCQGACAFAEYPLVKLKERTCFGNQ
jgi:hypothetical protein